MATDLFTPILNDRTRSVRFFNGRLLSGEAMTDEQGGQRVARELLAQAVGDGIAQGFEVKEAAGSSTTLSPVVAIGSGVAINRRGEILLLAADTEVKLVRPAHPSTAPASLFQTCTPPQQGVYVADSGVYLLTACSIGAANGLAQAGGLGGIQASCNAKYIVDAVQFRLLELPVDSSVLSDARARNLIAYRCFGVDHLLDFARDPFGTAGEPHTLLDDVRATKQLTDCDVPLALMYWTATGGIQFLDMWSVRRRVTKTNAPAHPLLTDRRLATAEAMIEQLGEQVGQLRAKGLLTPSLSASSTFRYLPPAGLLPLATGGLPGIHQDSFFSGQTTRGPAFLAGAALRHLLVAALDYPPVDLQSPDVIWLYLGVENFQAVNAVGGSNRPQGFLAFASGHVEYAANARFNLSLWDYANYARI
jgi:hypothetical protein